MLKVVAGGHTDSDITALQLQSFEKVAKVMERPFYMNPTKAVEFGVADKVYSISRLIVLANG